MIIRETTLDGYVGEMKRIAIDANTADYRGTSQHELDKIQQTSQTQYERGVKLINSLNEKEKGRCRKYYIYRNRNGIYYADYLVKCRFAEEWILVPAYISCLEEVRELVDLLHIDK